MNVSLSHQFFSLSPPLSKNKSIKNIFKRNSMSNKQLITNKRINLQSKWDYNLTQNWKVVFILHTRNIYLHFLSSSYECILSLPIYIMFCWILDIFVKFCSNCGCQPCSLPRLLLWSLVHVFWLVWTSSRKTTVPETVPCQQMKPWTCTPWPPSSRNDSLFSRILCVSPTCLYWYHTQLASTNS